MANIQSIPIGQKFNLLTIIEDLGWHTYGTQGRRGPKVKCVCDCGRETICWFDNVKRGASKSCGCLEARNKYSSIANKVPDYGKILSLWNNLNQRCYNLKHISYKNYGGRGIKVCDEWRNNFQPFYYWAIANGFEKGFELDRRDNDGNYCPENCQFATAKQNARNKRSNRVVEIAGIKKVLAQWAEESGLKADCLSVRLKMNWPQHKLLTPNK